MPTAGVSGLRGTRVTDRRVGLTGLQVEPGEKKESPAAVCAHSPLPTLHPERGQGCWRNGPGELWKATPPRCCPKIQLSHVKEDLAAVKITFYKTFLLPCFPLISCVNCSPSTSSSHSLHVHLLQSSVLTVPPPPPLSDLTVSYTINCHLWEEVFQSSLGSCMSLQAPECISTLLSACDDSLIHSEPHIFPVIFQTTPSAFLQMLLTSPFFMNFPTFHAREKPQLSHTCL